MDASLGDVAGVDAAPGVGLAPPAPVSSRNPARPPQYVVESWASAQPPNTLGMVLAYVALDESQIRPFVLASDMTPEDHLSVFAEATNEELNELFSDMTTIMTVPSP